ncbi:chromatin-remodeling ATPase INO80 [Enteropsectra breve]|nr:chromatin-remodeling ATPase INO80 [Enteropsectra breve]
MKEKECSRLREIFKNREIPAPKVPHTSKDARLCKSSKNSYHNKALIYMRSSMQEPISLPALKNVYKTLIHHVPRAYRVQMQNYGNIISQQKKLSIICLRELRRGLSRTSRTNPNLKNKRINKELQKHLNRTNKKIKDRKKTDDIKNEERRKNENLRKEEERQKRKFAYLMSQTEAFASFVLNKHRKELNEESIGASAAKRHLEFVKEFDLDKQTKTQQSGMEEYEAKDIKQPGILNTNLKVYQLKGLNWLVNLYHQGINGILADDMGLGKTVQSISMLGYLAETENVWGPFLVVTPASTLHNWEAEFKKFLPDFSVVVYYGTLSERAELKKQIKKANVVVTSYQIAVTDENLFKRIKWEYMILDEAQAIKSNSSVRWKTLLAFKTRNRCLLTGTPIQNNMQELWSLLHFIMPGLFDSLSEFSEWFLADNKVDLDQIDKLHTILKPFMLRRHKDDIKDEIGTKKILQIECKMSLRQLALYEEVLNTQLLGKKSDANEYDNVVMQLKKICNHPDLFNKLEPLGNIHFTAAGESSLATYRSSEKIFVPQHLLGDDASNGLPIKKPSAALGGILGARVWKHTGGLENPLPACLSSELMAHKRILENGLKRFRFLQPQVFPHKTQLFSSGSDKRLDTFATAQKKHGPTEQMIFVPPINTFIVDSGKLEALHILLKELRENNHRPLIYFQMTRMMDLFEEYLVKMEYPYLRLDGSCKVGARKELVKSWQSQDNIFIFILSTRAGGVGINLTAADTVIFYDSDWNPTVDQQAMDRVHRLGQTKDVTVYRLITKNSIEEKIMERANKKDEMQKIIIKGKVFEG